MNLFVDGSYPPWRGNGRGDGWFRGEGHGDGPHRWAEFCQNYFNHTLSGTGLRYGP